LVLFLVKCIWNEEDIIWTRIVSFDWVRKLFFINSFCRQGKFRRGGLSGRIQPLAIVHLVIFKLLLTQTVLTEGLITLTLNKLELGGFIVGVNLINMNLYATKATNQIKLIQLKIFAQE